MTAIIYLTKAGREERLGKGCPREFLYGFSELSEAGTDVGMVSDREMGFDEQRGAFLSRAANALIYRLCGLPAHAVWRLYCHRGRLKGADLVFVTTNTFGLGLGVLKRLGLLDAEVLFLAMGLVEPRTPTAWRKIYRWALAQTRVVALAARDARDLSSMLGRPVGYVPFGVDKVFWTPGQSELRPDDYVLSIGNDRHRDYATLLAAWRPEFPKLKIVTRLPLAETPLNVEIIRGDWHSQALSDAEIRTLMRGARFIVLPISDTVQPSGQSVALQAMACSKAVVITDYPGLWNRELMVDGKTCIFAGAPGAADDLAGAIRRAVGSPELCRRIGAAAREVVETDLNSDAMASALRDEMKGVLRRDQIPERDFGVSEGRS